MKIYSDLLEQRLYGFGIFTSGLRKDQYRTAEPCVGLVEEELEGLAIGGD